MKRGMYVDPKRGDMWAQTGTDGQERWRWINGDHFTFVPRDDLEFHSDLPDWY